MAEESKKQFDEPASGPVHSRDDYNLHFDAYTYLQEFYSKYDNEPAMHVVLTILPNIASRLPKGKRLLDVGCGPTVHVSMCFRRNAQAIYLCDYSVDCRKQLQAWLLAYKYGQKFDWSSIAKFITQREGQPDKWTEIENETKLKVKGILPCDVLKPGVIAVKNMHFDIVTSFFCFEAASESLQEYRNVIANVVKLVEPGGYFVLGGLLDQSWYRTGGKCYRCIRLSENDVFDALRQCDIDMEDQKTFLYFYHQGIFLIVGRRKETGILD